MTASRETQPFRLLLISSLSLTIDQTCGVLESSKAETKRTPTLSNWHVGKVKKQPPCTYLPQLNWLLDISDNSFFLFPFFFNSSFMINGHWCADISAFCISHTPVKWWGSSSYLQGVRGPQVVLLINGVIQSGCGGRAQSPAPGKHDTPQEPQKHLYLMRSAPESKVTWLSRGLKEVSLHCLKVINLCLMREKQSSESEYFSNVWIVGSNRPWRADAGEQESCCNPLSPGLTSNVKKEMDGGAESTVFLAQEFEGCTVNFKLKEVWGILGFAGGCLCNNKSFRHCNCLLSQRDFSKPGYRNRLLCWKGKGGCSWGKQAQWCQTAPHGSRVGLVLSHLKEASRAQKQWTRVMFNHAPKGTP